MLATDSYNPDVLSCLANLSSDEVFTPPQLANQVLDLLPQEIFKDKNAKFLDPVCKTGVFLREIAKRLDVGLESQIADLQKRMNHIFKNQLYGIAITELTALLSRRSLYCSKLANGKYSVCSAFDDERGNILFERVEHTWQKGRCTFCGASQAAYERGKELETHAYKFIHIADPKEVFNMEFDVIVGNPPYQLGSDGGTRDIPIYNKFVEQAKKLRPRYLTMVIPSRWMATGLGLSEFRSSMLQDRHIRKLVDYPVASEMFPGVEIKGGVCYFLWDRDYEGKCSICTVRGDDVTGPVERDLCEHDVLVRDSRAISILNKVLSYKEQSIVTLLSVDKEFGWTSNYEGFHMERTAGDVAVHFIRKMKRGVGWIKRSDVTKSLQLVDYWKVLVPQAGSDGGQKLPDPVLGNPVVVEPPSTCTQSYLFFYCGNRNEAESIASYLRTKFFRFLVSLRKITQHATRSTYTWVPVQSWNRKWTDEDLYKRYELAEPEIEYIEAMIKSMESI